jgi:hypothetical protein
VTSGSKRGTNGNARLAWAALAFILLLAAACTINALSILDDAARNGVALPRWEPFGLEYSSLAGSVIALPIVLLAERLAFGRHWLRLAILLPASILFSLVHVATMVALRHLFWWSQGESYGYDYGAVWLYEYRKDALTFAVAAAMVFLARRWPRRREEPQPVVTPPRVVMANGRKRVEVDIAELLAVNGGGNYSELVFAGGRTTLLRTTLSAAEQALASHGFRRAHKSWLVNLGKVRAVARTKSGDHCLTVGENLEVPLSRRCNDVLDEIRALATSRQGPVLLG